MKTLNYPKVQHFDFLKKVISNGGPEISEYDRVNRVVNFLAEEYKTGNLSQVDLQILQSSFDEECLSKTLHGHSITKPYGYAGDFMIIDKIYREQITDDRRFEKWDMFWHSLAATKAVRNRKDYFIRTVTRRMNNGKQVRLLNVASGPARDLAELYQQIHPDLLSTVCIEADERAIQYASTLNEVNAGRIQFVHKNIFRFQTEEQFDIVWSAGLFDYFDESIFVKLLRRFVSWTKPGGEVIIGNFNTQNPSRNLMEFFGDWYLHHRSAEELVNLALKAGVAQENIRVGKEAQDVNLFLHITNA